MQAMLHNPAVMKKVTRGSLPITLSSPVVLPNLSKDVEVMMVSGRQIDTFGGLSVATFRVGAISRKPHGSFFRRDSGSTLIGLLTTCHLDG